MPPLPKGEVLHWFCASSKATQGFHKAVFRPDNKKAQNCWLNQLCSSGFSGVHESKSRPVSTNSQELKICAPFGTASCWGVSAPNPAMNLILLFFISLLILRCFLFQLFYKGFIIGIAHIIQKHRTELNTRSHRHTVPVHPTEEISNDENFTRRNFIQLIDRDRQ